MFQMMFRAAVLKLQEPNATLPYRVLALSGGGSRGAYGVGVLTGWSESGERPEFDVVTGISTGALFVAVRGPRFDGHDFVEGAWRRGAAAALVERVPNAPIPFILARDSVRVLGELAAAWRNRFRDLVLVGAHADLDRAFDLLGARADDGRADGDSTEPGGASGDHQAE